MDAVPHFLVWITFECYVFVISLAISAIIIGYESNIKQCTFHITLLPKTYYFPSFFFSSFPSNRLWKKKFHFITTIIWKYWLFGVQYSTGHSVSAERWLLFVRFAAFRFRFVAGPFYWHLKNNSLLGFQSSAAD